MTPTGHVWQQIAGLLGGATDTVAVIAPFIKRPIFDNALAAVPASVEKIDCVTRWSPAEVAAGVSDPEIIETVRADSRVRVRLCPLLHAKIYLADDTCLVGSANLTARATGNAPDANVELLVKMAASTPEVQRVLRQIEAAATDATPEAAALVREQATFLATCRDSQPTGEPLPPWYPETRRPEYLYALYSASGKFTSAVQAGIVRDLAMLDIPAGLTEEGFNAAVRAWLNALPELQTLMEGKRISNFELQKAIEKRAELSPDQVQRVTETLAAWLRHFASYYTEIGSWELRPGREHV